MTGKTKNGIKKAARFLPHPSLVLALILLTLVITDLFNPLMAFIDHPFTRSLFLVFSLFQILFAFSEGLPLLQKNREKEKKDLLPFLPPVLLFLCGTVLFLCFCLGKTASLFCRRFLLVSLSFTVVFAVIRILFPSEREE